MPGAGEGNRTLVSCLGSNSSTIELHPHAAKSMPRAAALATRRGRGPRREALSRIASEAAADGDEHRRVVAALLADRDAGAHVGVETEHLRARAEQQRAVALVERQAGHCVLAAALARP